jgi:hypothetical protein
MISFLLNLCSPKNWNGYNLLREITENKRVQKAENRADPLALMKTHKPGAAQGDFFCFQLN